MCPASLSRSKSGPKISRGEGTAQFTPQLISCPCVTSASVGAKPRCSLRDDHDHQDPHRLPGAHDLPDIPQAGAGVGGRAGGPAPTSRGGEAKGCPGAAQHAVPTGNTRVYSNEGELMQFPSSRYMSGAARAAGGKEVIKGSLEISSHASPTAGTYPSTPAMLGVRSQPWGIREEGLERWGLWTRLSVQTALAERT